jgi:ABC-2 type transport system ATP-binding protein
MADTDTNNNIVVEAVGLTKVFKDFWGRPKARAVNGIDFKIRQGEVFGLLGPNGSGKSTTIKMILGLLYPTRGKLEVFGQDPQNVDMKSRIGYLPEETFLYKYLTAYETLDFYGALFGLSAEQRKVRATQLLEMVGLSHAFDRPVGEFSKGMARRIGLAQALVNDPDLVILDEPTSGLDPIGCREVKDVIRLLASRGKTIILCSHLLADVQDVCNSVTVLFGGQIRAQGALSEILCESDKTQIITPRLSPETINELRNFLKAHGLNDIDAVKIDNPDRNLEDYFLDVVRKASEQNVATAGAQSNGEIPEYLQGQGNDSSQAILDALRRRPEEEKAKAAAAAAEAKLKEATEAAKARQLEQLQELKSDDKAAEKQSAAAKEADAAKEAEEARKREELNKKLASLRK